MLSEFLMQEKKGLDNLKNENIDLLKIIDVQLFKLKYQKLNKNTHIEFKNLGFVYGNKYSLASLFSNLISNALKFQPKTEGHKPVIKITQVDSKNEHLITVEDNGIGIKQSNLSSIFMPFKRLHNQSSYKGIGLGLSICKSIVEDHKGTLKVNSKLNKGTIFEISLPKENKTKN